MLEINGACKPAHELRVLNTAQPEVFAALNSALAPLGIRITSASGDQWSVSDGKSLARFQDGMVGRFSSSVMKCPHASASCALTEVGDLKQTLPGKGAASLTRGQLLLAHFKTPGVISAAAAATAASNAAAARAGLMPGPDMAGSAFNGAGPGEGQITSRCLHTCPARRQQYDAPVACAAGFNGALNGMGYAGQPFLPGGAEAGDMNGGGPERRQRHVSGGQGPQQARRLKAQGRYTPY